MQVLKQQPKYSNENSFTVSLSRGLPRTAYIFIGDGAINIMQEACMLAANWSQEELDHHAALKAMTPLRDGDEVTFEGQQYIVQINGDYSDMGILATKEEYAETQAKRKEKKEFFESRDIASDLFEKKGESVTLADIREASKTLQQAHAVGKAITYLVYGSRI
jgi:hypothetical protein